MKVGFLGMGVMGLPMAKKLVKKAGCEILGFDVVESRQNRSCAGRSASRSTPPSLWTAPMTTCPCSGSSRRNRDCLPGNRNLHSRIR